MHKLFIKLSRKKKAYTEPNNCIKHKQFRLASTSTMK